MQRVYEENEWGKVSKIIITASVQQNSTLTSNYSSNYSKNVHAPALHTIEYT